MEKRRLIIGTILTIFALLIAMSGIIIMVLLPKIITLIIVEFMLIISIGLLFISYYISSQHIIFRFFK